MNHQEKEIRNLNKIIAIQGDLLKMNKDILVPMYKKHITKNQKQIGDTNGNIHRPKTRS
jgi:hypothetical protein